MSPWAVLILWAPISSADAQPMRLKVGRGQVGAQGGGSGGSRAEENRDSGWGSQAEGEGAWD